MMRMVTATGSVVVDTPVCESLARTLLSPLPPLEYKVPVPLDVSVGVLEVAGARGLVAVGATPTRIEAFVIAADWIVSIVSTAANINTFAGNLYRDSISAQVWGYVANRTGIIAYANLPLMWILSGRNNVSLSATDWDYSSFHNFYRHIGRAATIQAIIHSIAYTVIYKDGGYYKEDLAETWFYLGIMVATVAFGALIISSSV